MQNMKQNRLKISYKTEPLFVENVGSSVKIQEWQAHLL